MLLERRCVGLDVHARSVVGCAIMLGGAGSQDLAHGRADVVHAPIGGLHASRGRWLISARRSASRRSVLTLSPGGRSSFEGATTSHRSPNQRSQGAGQPEASRAGWPTGRSRGPRRSRRTTPAASRSTRPGPHRCRRRPCPQVQAISGTPTPRSGPAGPPPEARRRCTGRCSTPNNEPPGPQEWACGARRARNRPAAPADDPHRPGLAEWWAVASRLWVHAEGRDAGGRGGLGLRRGCLGGGPRGAAADWIPILLHANTVSAVNVAVATRMSLPRWGEFTPPGRRPRWGKYLSARGEPTWMWVTNATR